MTRTSSAASLLNIAAQDLHAGKALLARRLPPLRDRIADGETNAVFGEEIARAAAQAERLARVAGDMQGPANLWMTGILDDADRDARSHQPGPLLDVALIGAIRKAMAATIVSSETAIALASRCGLPGIRAAVEENRTEEIATDRALAERLTALTA